MVINSYDLHLLTARPHLRPVSLKLLKQQPQPEGSHFNRHILSLSFFLLTAKMLPINRGSVCVCRSCLVLIFKEGILLPGRDEQANTEIQNPIDNLIQF